MDAAGYSWSGLKQAWQQEAAFRQEVLLCVVLFPAAFWLGSNLLETALLLVSLFVLLIVELLNSALEAVVDRVGSEWHVLSGRAKDIASAAVLIALVQVAVIWLLVALHRFL